MKKFIAGVALLFLFAGLAQAATVNVTSANVGVGDSFTLTVSGVGFPANGGATLGLAWDKAIVRIDSLTLAGGSPFNFIDPGVVSDADKTAGAISLFSLLAPLVGALPSGDFVAFEINGTKIAAGTSAVNLIDDGTIRGWTAEDFELIPDVTYNQGIVSSTVPVPAAVWLFGSGLGLLGWVRRKAT